jgi:hypothetical protein
MTANVSNSDGSYSVGAYDSYQRNSDSLIPLVEA